MRLIVNNTKRILSVFCIGVLTIFGCDDKETDEAYIDFMSKFSGIYKCTKTYTNVCGDDNEGHIKWCTRTEGFGINIIIETDEDSSLNVSIDNDLINMKFIDDSAYLCSDCFTFANYDHHDNPTAIFFPNDSISVSIQSGVTGYYRYFGNKE